MFLVFISLIISSCNQSLNQLKEKQKNMEYDTKGDKTIIRTFLIEWQLQNNILTQLPATQKDEAIKKCGHKRLVLVKIDTDNNNNARGTYKCID